MSKVISSTIKPYKIIDSDIKIQEVKETVEQEITKVYLSVDISDYYILKLIKADLRDKGVDFDSATTKAKWIYHLTSSERGTDFTFQGVQLRQVHV
jgi:hypothetical protein